MPVQRRLEVKKTLVLEFTLPGVTAHSASYSGQDTQLKNDDHYRESWSLRVNQENALQVASVLEELASVIRQTVP